MMFRSAPKAKRGFTLIELAIVLAVASLLFGGLWRLMASGSAQLRDQVAADQHKKLIVAVQAYLASQEGQTFVANLAPSGGVATLALPASAGGCAAPTAGFCNFLPAEITSNTTNSYSQYYSIRVRKESSDPAGTSAKNYSFMIMTYNGDTIPDTSGGRIASMIGGDGGFIYTTDVCGGTTYACGSYGTWRELLSGYGLAGSGGRIASRSYMGLATAINTPWLARTQILSPTVYGTPDFNTVQTNIFLKNTANSSYAPASTTGNDLYLGNNKIYGGSTSTDVGGQISNLHYARINMTATGDNSALIVNSFGGCSQATGYGLAYCTDVAVQVNGDQNVKGLLQAYWLYAYKFIYNSSDERLKHDIKPIEHALDDLDKIRALSFTMNGDNERRYGVLAQEVEKVYPDLVDDIGNGYKGVDYMGLIGPLLGAVKELRGQNAALQQQLDQQAARLRALETGAVPQQKKKAP